MSVIDTTPWYKQFWPWFLISIPALTVVAGLGMLYTASRNADGIVVDDYYKTGLAINQTLSRDKHAEALGLQAVGRIDLASKQIHLTLHGQSNEPTLQLTLSHPTSAQWDMSIELKQGGGKGEYLGQLTSLPQEKRYILLEPGDKAWRLTGHAMFPDMLQWSLRPGL